MSAYLAALISYFILLAGIGLIVHRRSSNAEDFMVGGRSLNFWVTALSAHASDMSSWLFMAFPGLVYLQGLQGVWVAIGLWIGMWGAWQFVAPKLRIETERTKTYTLTSYLAKRFGSSERLIPVVSGLASLLFFSVYVASGFVGIGFLFETLLGTDRLLGIGLAIVIVAGYTAVGGFYSICWVDFWQALFLLIVIILVPLTMIVGGPVDLWSSVSFFPRWESGGSPLSQIAQGVLLMLGWGLGYFGQGHILAKFMGIKSPAELRKSQMVGLSWQALCLVAATFIGLLGQAYFSVALENSELVFVKIVVSLFPPFAAGFVLCAVLAATISTIDSQVIVLVSVLSEDFYHKFLRRTASQREIVVVSRLATLLVCGMSFLVAARLNASIMALVMYAWSGLGSAFGPIVLCALHSRIRSPHAAVAGIVVGAVVSACWPWIDQVLPLSIPALIPGFILSLLAIIIAEWRARRQGKLGAPVA